MRRRHRRRVAIRTHPPARARHSCRAFTQTRVRFVSTYQWLIRESIEYGFFSRAWLTYCPCARWLASLRAQTPSRIVRPRPRKATRVCAASSSSRPTVAVAAVRRADPFAPPRATAMRTRRRATRPNGRFAKCAAITPHRRPRHHPRTRQRRRAIDDPHRHRRGIRMNVRRMIAGRRTNGRHRPPHSEHRVAFPRRRANDAVMVRAMRLVMARAAAAIGRRRRRVRVIFNLRCVTQISQLSLCASYRCVGIF